VSEQVHTPDYNEVWTSVYGDMQHVGPVHRHMKRVVRSLLAPLTYESVLDVGCGTGDNISLLTEGRQIKRLTGADISSWAVQRAQETHKDREFRVHDIQERPMEGQWDLVYSSLLLEHLVDDVTALHNMRAMTGKYLLVTTIAGNFERYKAWDTRVGHVRNYQVGELEGKVRDAGFVVEKIIYWGFPFYTPLVRTLQNRSDAATGTFSVPARIAAQLLYFLYFLNSRKRGDVLFLLARV
jgi:SAM-dependent methyltransferase